MYAHEMGHNIGMDHASTETYEDGDNSDIMRAQGGLMPVNSAHKTQMGWLVLGAASTVAVTEDGIYPVAPLPGNAGSPSNPQVLRMSKADSADAYYISFSARWRFRGKRVLPVP